MAAPLLRPMYLGILFPHLRTLPKTDPRRANVPPAITGFPAIDVELYTFFALLIRDFVNPWYRLVTQDQDLCNEVVRLLTLVIRRLHVRLCSEVDWTELLLINAPRLLTIHYHDYRQAKARQHTDHASGSSSVGELFHGMQPHFALQPVKDREAEYLRLLVEGILQQLLDTADYESDAVRHLIREILANVVLSNLIESISDPYTVHTIICKLLVGYGSLLDELEASGDFSETYFGTLPSALPTPVRRSDTTMQTSTPAQAQKVLPIQLLKRYKERRKEQGEETAMDEAEAADDHGDASRENPKRWRFSFRHVTLQVVLAPIHALWIYIAVLFSSSQERYQKVNQHTKRTRHVRLIEPATQFLKIAFLVNDRPMLQWAWQMVAMFVWPLVRVFGGGLLIDKFLEQTILHLLNEDHIVYYLRLGRDLLWPDGVFLRTGEPPTPLQREQMRVRAERLLTVAFPANAGKAVFGTTDLDELQVHMHDMIEPVQNKYINKHLMFLLVDLVASTLLPELR